MPETSLQPIDTIDTDKQWSREPIELDRDELFELRVINGISARNIAKIKEIGVSTVYKYIDKWNIPTRARALKWKQNRAEMLADKQRIILDTIDDETIKKASLVQRTTAACQLYDKERLERDLSTNNVSVMHASDYAKDIADLDAAYEELSAK